MRTPRKSVVLSLSLLALPLAACGGDDDSGSDGGSPPPPGAVHVVAEDSLSFDQHDYSADAGEVTFVYDGGSILHTLVVDGYEDEMRLEIQGDEDEGTIELEAGEYEIYCDVAGHRAAGMEATVTVE